MADLHSMGHDATIQAPATPTGTASSDASSAPWAEASSPSGPSQCAPHHPGLAPSPANDGMPQGPAAFIMRRSSAARRWARLGCGVAAVGVFLAAAATIDPAPSPAGERLSDWARPMAQSGQALSPDAAPSSDGSLDQSGHSASEPPLLGSLEGIEATVWFYAGVSGPLASLSSATRGSIDRVPLDQLYRLAPELRLDSGISMLGEVPVGLDGLDLDF